MRLVSSGWIDTKKSDLYIQNYWSRQTSANMGVHSQGESGFFDEDTELPLEQNESVGQHETANEEPIAGKCEM